MQVNLYPRGKLPLVWFVDDANIFIVNAYDEGVPLYLEGKKRSPQSGFTFAHYLMEEVNPKLRVTLAFVIAPKYAAAGLPQLQRFERPISDPRLRNLHEELQRWIEAHRDRCEVVVHGWTHQTYNYNPADELNPGGWEYTRRSEWFKHPKPVEVYTKCVETLERLGYSVEPRAFSAPGGRADVETLRELRNSPYRVIAKFTTQLANFPVDYGVIADKPLYLDSIDIWVLPVNIFPSTPFDEVERMIDKRVPLSYISHGYEPCVPWEADVSTVEFFERLTAKYEGEIVFLTMGEYADFLYNQAHKT
ncbi:MAG: DUF2334 domain-containing protein [bacterium]